MRCSAQHVVTGPDAAWGADNLGVLVAAAAAPALGDGPTGLRLIQRGTSAGGQKWVQTARADHSRIMVEIEIPLDNGEDGGGILDGLFVHFFEADDRPTRIEALDAHGKVVAWEPGIR
jgi:hypothetical protein